MKQIIKQIALIERIDQLVRLQCTGAPKKLASKLEISEAKLYRIIDTMKELGAPISYDFSVESYVYNENTDFKCAFYTQELSNEEARRYSGGRGFNSLLKLVNN